MRKGSPVVGWRFAGGGLRDGVIAFVILVLPTAVAGQRPQERPDLGIRAWTSPDVEALHVVGTVMDGDMGVALESVQVYLRGEIVGVLTDRDGRFSLRIPSSGTFTLVAETLGYRMQSTALFVPPDEGLVVQITTEQQSLSSCGMMVCPYPGCGSGVSVEVRDLETGTAPEVQVTLSVFVEGEMDSATGVAPARDSAYLASRIPGPGYEAAFDSITATLPVKLHAGAGLGMDRPFGVEVSAPGYYPWGATGVWVVRRECLPPMSKTLRVWLQPRGGQRSGR